MSDDLGLDLRADPPKPPWSRADIGCGIVLAVLFGSVLVCVLSPVRRYGYLDDANVQATEIAMKKLADRIDATGALPAALSGETDAWGNPFELRPACNDGTGSYSLVSLGKDGRPGGEGYSADLRFESTVPLACR